MEAEVRLAEAAYRPNFGALGSESDVLAVLTQRLAGQLDPAMIWLFGSRARRDGRPDSDFDLLVVAKEDGTSRFDAEDYDRVYGAVSGLGIGVDVVPCDFETYLASLELRTSFVYRIVQEGRLLYEALG